MRYTATVCTPLSELRQERKYSTFEITFFDAGTNKKIFLNLQPVIRLAAPQKRIGFHLLVMSAMLGHLAITHMKTRLVP